MAWQKVAKKKKYWETSELIAARSEAVRLHSTLKYTTVEIGNELGKSPTQIWRWLKAARVFQPISPKKAGEKRHIKYAARSAARIKRKQEMVALKAKERLSRLYVCKECKSPFRPVIGFQDCCSPACRTKSYLKSPNGILSAKRAEVKSSQRRRSNVERLYAAENPKCNCCLNPIPFSIFFRHRDAKYCSRKCSRKALSESRKNDPIKAEKYKLIKKKTDLKRKLNGKSRDEKREYFRNNIQARIAKNLRTRVYLAVRKQGGKKCAPTMELIGTDLLSFCKWIQSQFQSGMSWGNHGLWHYHHKIPCAAFDLTKPEQQKECFHYTNYQPMWAIENIKRGAKIFPTQLPFRF